MRYDPGRVGGLEVNQVPSGIRADAPAPTGKVTNTDGGDIDRIVLTAMSDIEEYWAGEYPKNFGGPLRPVDALVSIDPKDPRSPNFCGGSARRIAFNAAYCDSDNAIAWDRTAKGVLAAAKTYFGGDMAVVGILAHEFGHAIQFRAHLADGSVTLVKEQQADCFGGVYLRWVAEGHSRRFTLSTGDGLNYLLAGELAIRDELSNDQVDPGVGAHGTGLDRVSALQTGFEQGAQACAAIDEDEIARRRGDLPESLFSSANEPSDTAIDENTLTALVDALNQIFKPSQPPALKFDAAGCGDDRKRDYAAYCPSSNSVTVDLPALQRISAPADESSEVLLQGDNTAISLVTSRYVMALQRQRGLPLDTPRAAMLTACLTGVAQREMAQSSDDSSERGALTLGPGDLDEAVAGLLTNGVVASDVDNETLPAGFTRIAAYRSGLLGTADECLRRF